uniref:Uncharacterized protein n=1 Tax=Romanomermis culicivorax TaxID=13658 RepID=A0A915J864_ROMCU
MLHYCECWMMELKLGLYKASCNITCPSKWIAGPSNKFPGCFRQYMLFNKSLPNSTSSGLSFCQGYDKRAHLIYLPNLDNGTDLIELG